MKLRVGRDQKQFDARSSNRGSALIQIVMATGILALTSYLVTSTLSSMNASRKSTSYTHEVDALHSLLTGMFSTPELCTKAISFAGNRYPRKADNTGQGDTFNIRIGMPFYRGASGSNRDFNGINLACTGNEAKAFPCPDSNDNILDDLSLRIETVQFVQTRNFIPADDNTPLPSQRVYQGVIRLNVSSTKANVYSSSTRELANIRLIVKSTNDDQDGEFIGCYTQLSPQEACSQLGGLFDDTLTPKCRMGFRSMDCETPSAIPNSGPGAFIAGINEDGTPVCRKKEFKCTGAGMVLIGVVNGVAQCREFIPNAPSTGYAWIAGGWSSCTKVCGTGTQTRSYDCKNSSNNIVSDTLCAPPAPADEVRNCNTQLCTAEFVAASSTVAEGAARNVAVRLQAAQSADVIVRVSRSASTTVAGDYTPALPASLTFTAGQTTKNLTINAETDSLAESSESLNLLLTVLSGPATIGVQSTHALTVTNVSALPDCNTTQAFRNMTSCNCVTPPNWRWSAPPFWHTFAGPMKGMKGIACTRGATCSDLNPECCSTFYQCTLTCLDPGGPPCGVPNKSDERVKKDIELLSGIEIIKQLRGVKFHYTDAIEKGGPYYYGVIAQDVEKVLPEAVDEDLQGIKSVDYIQLIGPLVQAVKELSQENATLREENKMIRQDLERLKNEFHRPISKK